ncbi:DUF1415 domain-containing protein [Litorimonas cladophorae]|nr:DUF1415 domain-containing protein [Litorimonas cladophorae]
MPDHLTLISHTQKWLSEVIIHHGLCPFAKREYDAGRIHYAVIETGDLQSQLEQIMLQCLALDADPDRETSLLIFPTALSDFETYLDLLDVATAVLNDQGYEGVYQLASFHPQYRFDGADENDASNYTNRSPYPMLHILREASVERAINNHPNPEKIPDRNIELTRALGLDAMQASLAACYK